VISVLIPTRSNADGLRRALRSVRAQRGVNWEALVIDDGAGEGLTVAKGFGDGRIRAYRNPNHGAIAARNAGLEVARGAVIAWLGDTDFWTDADHLSRVCQALKFGEALTYSAGWLRRFEDDLEPEPQCPKSQLPESQLSGSQRLKPDSPLVTLESLRSENPLLVSAIAYPSVMHDWFGTFDASLGLTWDWDWHLRLASSGVPLRRIAGSSVSALMPTTPSNPATWSRDLALLVQKHGLAHLDVPRAGHARSLQLVATD
jgi:glycosyltransferase involved in cell wall biosynthesis